MTENPTTLAEARKLTYGHGYECAKGGVHCDIKGTGRITRGKQETGFSRKEVNDAGVIKTAR